MDIQPIDFRRLLREEKRKARKNAAKTASNQFASDTSNPSPAPLPPWAFPEEQFSIQSLCMVCNNPPLIRYIPTFVSLSYQAALMEWLEKLQDNSNPSSSSGALNRWTRLPHARRRVAVFDSRVGIPEPLQPLLDAVAGLFQQRPNHILVNEYTAGQGILGHTDGPAYESCTATVSLGSDVLLHFTKNNETTRSVQVLLEAGSLVVFSSTVYDDYRHSIDEGVDEEVAGGACVNAGVGTRVQRGHRISLTIRHKKELDV